MARKPQTNPRKQATQDRSRHTVDALLEATARVLVKEGYDTASTNKIAEAAGVSIGSLYQYFPGKEALVAAVIDRHMGAMMDVARTAIAEVMTLPIAPAVRRLVEVMIEAHRVNPRLHRVLFEQIPRTGRLEDVEKLDREAYALVRDFLDAHREELTVQDLDMAAVMSVDIIETLTHTAVIDNPQLVAGDRLELFTGEVTRVVVALLQGAR